MSRPATTDHWAKVLPLKAEVPPLSLGIVRMRMRPTLDQCWILHAWMRCSSTPMSYAAMLCPTSTSASRMCSLQMRKLSSARSEGQISSLSLARVRVLG